MARLNPRPRRRFRIDWGRWLSRAALLLLAAGIGVFGSQLYVHMFEREYPVLASDEEFFKYGAIGNENDDGIPFKIWAVLPEVCPTQIGPDGYKGLGFIFEPGKDTPIGLSKTRIGFDRVAINCATCHSQIYKTAADAKPVTVIGGTAAQLESQAYLRFISGCITGPDFTADKVMAALEKRFPQTSWFEAALFRYVVVPFTRDQTRTALSERYAWTWDRPSWGPGRVDPFNPVKFDYLKQPIDATIGNSDIMPAWNARRKEDLVKSLRPGAPIYWHWDGLNSDLFEVVINSALGDGTRDKEYDEAKMRRLLDYLHVLKSPKAPIQPNPQLRAQGEAVFNRECASCHGEKGDKTLTLIPAGVIGTDPHRLAMWTDGATTAYNNYDQPAPGSTRKKPYVLDKFNNIEGYIAQPLWGVWLAGPYLHNGSVPTLYDLLSPPEKRPKAFVRGLVELDLVKGGYSAPPCLPGAHQGPGFCYDTAQPGNSNDGHRYGNSLSEAERRALVFYLLTL